MYCQKMNPLYLESKSNLYSLMFYVSICFIFHEFWHLIFCFTVPNFLDSCCIFHNLLLMGACLILTVSFLKGNRKPYSLNLSKLQNIVFNYWLSKYNHPKNWFIVTHLGKDNRCKLKPQIKKCQVNIRTTPFLQQKGVLHKYIGKIKPQRLH